MSDCCNEFGNPTPIEPPIWDSMNPVGSLTVLAWGVRKSVRKEFLQHGSQKEHFIFVQRDGGSTLLSVSDPDNVNRDELATWLKSHIVERNIFGVIHVAQGFGCFPDTPGGEDAVRQIVAGEMKMSDLNESDRQEYLTVMAQARTGDSIAWVDKIVRDGDNVTLGDSKPFRDYLGCYGNLFVES